MIEVNERRRFERRRQKRFEGKAACHLKENETERDKIKKKKQNNN